jgi:histidyl-tRNA synthetase
MSKAKKVKPAQPGGFNDYPPGLMTPRTRLIDTIRRVYELYGFQALDTPCVEFTEVLVGDGGETEKEIIRLVGPEED